MTCLESLPNELLLLVINHLSSPDLLHAFYGLNHRFDQLIYQSLHRFIIVDDPADDILEKSIIEFQHLIELISCDVGQARHMFSDRYSFANLRTLILRCPDHATVELSVDAESVTLAFQSCLNVLSSCDLFNDNREEPTHSAGKLLPCPAIVRLSIEECSQQSLLSVLSLAPQLRYLRVKQLIAFDQDSLPPLSSDASLRLTSLKHLSLSATIKRLNGMTFIGEIIQCCQTSLEHLSLEISLDSPMDISDLQRIFEPCEKLTKIHFAFNCLLDDDEEVDILSQFETDWWLDARRPAVLGFRSGHCEIWIVSMPCHFDSYVWFPIDLNDWRINKGHLNSTGFYFTKQKSIRLACPHRQLLTPELLRLLGQVFRAPNQELSIPHASFVSPDLLIDQVRRSPFLIHLQRNERFFSLFRCCRHGLIVRSYPTSSLSI